MTRAQRPHTHWHALLQGCAVAVCALFPLASHAERMTLQDAVEQALGNSPEVLIARERVHQARENVMETRGELKPQVDLSISGGREFNTPAGARIRGETPGDYSTSYDASVGATQRLYDGKQTRSEILRREEILEGTNYRATSIRHKVAQQMVETFLAIYQQQQALASVNIFVGRLEDLSAKMDLYAEEGNASKTLQKYVSSRLANAKQVQVQITNALQDSLESYTFLTQEPLDLHGTQLVLMRLPALDSFDAYQQMMQGQNPELKAAIADLDAAKAEYTKAKGNFHPSVNLNTEWADSRNVGGKVGQVRSGSAMVELRYKVYDGNTRDATLRRMVSQQKEKDLQVERTRRKNDQILRSAWQTLSAKLKEEALIRQELADTMDVRNLRQQEFEEGAGDLVQLVETEEKLFAAARQKLNVDTAILTNRFALEFLTGKPHLSGSEEYLPFNPFDRLKSYSELLEAKAQVAPALATTGSVDGAPVTPADLPMPETEEPKEEPKKDDSTSVTPDRVVEPVAEQPAPVDAIAEPEVKEEVAPVAEIKEDAPVAVEAEEAAAVETPVQPEQAAVEEPAETETAPQAEAVPMEGQSPEQKAAKDQERTAEVERLLGEMGAIEPAAGEDEPVLHVSDVPLEEREEMFPDVYMPRKQASTLVIPENFELPKPTGR